MYLCIHIIKYVYKGADETSPLIGHFCRASANETLPTVVLPGTSAWVRVVLVPQLPMSGFQMRYRRTGLFRFSHSTSMTRKLAVAEKPRVALSPYCKCWYLQYYWMSLMLQTLYIINVKKLFQFRSQCKDVKSNIQNCTNHFGEDTWLNALAALTYLGHVTPFLTV